MQNGDIDLHPGHIVQTYVRTVAKFGPSIEIRSGMRQVLFHYIIVIVSAEGRQQGSPKVL